jgi:CBS domain containing-hemolysin-like protein
MTFAHVVIGEVVPKNIAIEKSDGLAVTVAPVLLLFYRVTGPFVFVIERSARSLSRLIGLKGATLGGGHSAEELKFIIASSRRHGQLESFEESAIRRMLELQDYLVREIMVPRNEIISIPLDAGLDQVLQLMREHQLSRIPVYEGEPEHIVGIVHYKDFLTVWNDRRLAAERHRPVPRFHIRYLMTKPPVVPETKPVNQLVDDFRTEHSHMALVVDEFGSVVGLVTLEDALEQIFGEIEDEHDVHLPPVTDHSPVVELEGGANIRDLEMQYAIELPVDAGFETLAGFVLHRLGRIPSSGDTVEYEDYRFTVLSMDRNRIAKIKVERFEAETGEDEPPD